MGRGQECQLKVSDISVSRNHCEIEYHKGKFRIRDMGSKFGTLTLAQGKIEILPGTLTGMQIGRTLMVFEAKPIKKEMKVG
mmetsp:Transcript_33032/g.50619  ORF Transcript_33032/g.50619 Transcript_33032/m.50619 type:complete len:81 (-) Transcript_33032:1256-1498(-)